MKAIIIIQSLIQILNKSKTEDFERRFKEIKAAEQESRFLAEVNSEVHTVKSLEDQEKTTNKSGDDFFVSDDSYFKDQSLISNNEDKDRMRFKQKAAHDYSFSSDNYRFKTNDGNNGVNTEQQNTVKDTNTNTNTNSKQATPNINIYTKNESSSNTNTNTNTNTTTKKDKKGVIINETLQSPVLGTTFVTSNAPSTTVVSEPTTAVIAQSNTVITPAQTVDCGTNFQTCAMEGAVLPPNSACWNGHAWVDCTTIGQPVHSVYINAQDHQHWTDQVQVQQVRHVCDYIHTHPSIVVQQESWTRTCGLYGFV